jgi:hypothetical protein
MNIYVDLILFALIILVYWIITELFTILFRFTGLPDERARFQALDAGAELDDLTGKFMSQLHWIVADLHVPVPEVQLPVAQAAACDFQQNLSLSRLLVHFKKVGVSPSAYSKT